MSRLYSWAKPKNVLIIEDNDEYVKIAKDAITKIGIRVDTAKYPQTAMTFRRLKNPATLINSGISAPFAMREIDIPHAIITDAMFVKGGVQYPMGVLPILWAEVMGIPWVVISSSDHHDPQIEVVTQVSRLYGKEILDNRDKTNPDVWIEALEVALYNGFK